MKLNKLLPKTLLAKLPPLESDLVDSIVQAKYFYPAFSWTWYAVTYDPKEQVFFGLVDGNEKELGYFSLKELMETKDKLGNSIERDLYFTPVPLSTLYDLEKRGMIEGGIMDPGNIDENITNIAKAAKII